MHYSWVIAIGDVSARASGPSRWPVEREDHGAGLVRGGGDVGVRAGGADERWSQCGWWWPSYPMVQTTWKALGIEDAQT